MPLAKTNNRGDYVKAVERVREQVAELQAEFAERMPMWTLFGPGTSDHPGMFVARLWLVAPKLTLTNVVFRAGSLAELRDLLPANLVCFPRASTDDPNIIESWL